MCFALVSLVNTQGNNLLHDERNWEKVIAGFKYLEECSLHLQILFHPTTVSQSWTQSHEIRTIMSLGMGAVETDALAF